VQIASIAHSQRCTWWQSLSKSELLAPESIGLVANLLQYKGYCSSLPPHDALAAIYHHGQVIERFAAAAPASARASVIANLQALLAASLEIDGGRFLTPYAWVRRFKAGGITAPAVAASDAVRLLTVHGAKGLEAQVVILLDTDAQAVRAQSMDVLIDWPAERAAPQLFAFLTSEANAPACVQDALQREHAERAREETNALYVAMTRAQTTLVASSVEPYTTDAGSWWAQLTAQDVNAVQIEGESIAGYAASVLARGISSDVVARSEIATFYIKKLPLAEQNRAQAATKSIAYQFVKKIETDAARIGQAMHRLLEWHVPGADDAQTVQAVATQFNLNAAQVHAAAEMHRAITQGEAAWAWNSDLIDWHSNEVELLHNSKLLRIDRLVRRSDTGAWWVLDYKSAHVPERDTALRAQLAEYAEAVRAAHPGDAVQAAFITGQGRLVPLQN
jgi:ATP-dependent helicase/nuclease subunit A